jgi:radical SAM protein with 4Fe4S-binding SPASM domain
MGADMIVVWRVVTNCNLSCSFCAFDRRLAFPRSQIDPRDVLRFAEVLAEHQSRTGDRVLLSWLGGEPLLWKPLTWLTGAVRALGLEVSATTNGSTLGSASVRRHLCESYRELTISVDGFSGFHDSMRGWPGGFEKLRSWVPALASDALRLSAPLKLRANVVLMSQNLGDFAALCAELAEWGIAEISYNQLGGRDRPEFYPTHRLSPANVDLLESQLPEIRRLLHDRGVVLAGGEEYMSRIRASTRDERMPIEDCRPGDSFLFIDEAGRISPCSFTTGDYGIDMRGVKTADDLTALPGMYRAVRQAKRSPQCNDCLSTQVCGKFQPSLANKAKAAAA